ncbi:MAG: hypothetical protein R6W84_14100 [Promethearchaeia archaeon]
MSNFLVPIDTSNVRKVIPVGQDITHSIYMNIVFNNYHGTAYNHITHVLVTSQGLAWTKTDWKKNEELVFTPWNEAELIKPGIIYLIPGFIAFPLGDKVDPKETDVKYAWNFYFETIKNAIAYFQEEVDKLPEKSESKQIRTKRAKLSKFVRTYKKKSEAMRKKAIKKGYIS